MRFSRAIAGVGLGLAALLLSPNPAVVSAAPDVVGKPFAQAKDYKPVIGRYGGRLTRSTLSEPKSFNPITSGETSTSEYTDRMFQGLTNANAFTGDVEPALAEKWEVAADGVTWTFHLRKGVKFNDGTPFTARDVVFTWNQAVYDNTRPDPAQRRWTSSISDSASFDGKPIKVEYVDDHTVRVITPVKVAILEEIMSAPIISEARYKGLVADGKFGSSMSKDSAPGDVVGTGPFMLKEYVPGKRVVLSRNPHYWRSDAEGNELPYLDELVFLIVPTTNAMLLNFEQKLTDVYSLQSGKDVELMLPKQEKDDFSLYQLGPDHGTMFVTFNMNLEAANAGRVDKHKIEWFRDARFRRAVSHAINRDLIVRQAYRGFAYAQGAPYTLAAGPYKQDGFGPYEYDVKKAKDLLAAMGFRDNGKGFLVDEKGRELSFTINTNAGNQQREQMVDIVRSNLEAVGIKVNVLNLEFNLLVQKLDASFDWEAIVMGFTGGREPLFASNLWKSGGRLHMWWPLQKEPSFEWEKKIDDIFFASAQELDKAKRKELFRQWVEIVHREQPLVYLAVPERLVVVRNRFGNLFPSPAPTNPVMHNEDEIFILKGK